MSCSKKTGALNLIFVACNIGILLTLADGFRYTNNTNAHWLTPEEIQKLVGPFESGIVID